MDYAAPIGKESACADGMNFFLEAAVSLGERSGRSVFRKAAASAVRLRCGAHRGSCREENSDQPARGMYMRFFEKIRFFRGGRRASSVSTVCAFQRCCAAPGRFAAVPPCLRSNDTQSAALVQLNRNAETRHFCAAVCCAGAAASAAPGSGIRRRY